MPAQSFFAQIQVYTRDGAGFVTPYVGDIEIRLLDDSTLLDTLETDVGGTLEAGIIPSFLAGTAIYFKSPDYSETLIQETGADAEDAYLRNLVTNLYVDDHFSDTVSPDVLDVYLQDDGNPDAPRQYLGAVMLGATITVPYESAFDKNLTVYAVPRGAGAVQTGFSAFADVPSAAVPVAGFAAGGETETDYADEFLLMGS